MRVAKQPPPDTAGCRLVHWTRSIGRKAFFSGLSTSPCLLWNRPLYPIKSYAYFRHRHPHHHLPPFDPGHLDPIRKRRRNQRFPGWLESDGVWKLRRCELFHSLHFSHGGGLHGHFPDPDRAGQPIPEKRFRRCDDPSSDFTKPTCNGHGSGLRGRSARGSGGEYRT